MVESGYRELIVLRHAKTEQVASSDRARQLTSRGRGDARAAGRWLRDNDLAPDLILTSPAARAKATAELVADEVGTTPAVQVVGGLYGASVDEVVEAITDVADAARRVLVVGHNPTMEELVQAMQKGPDEPWAPHLPTAGLAVLRIPGPWAELSLGRGKVTERHVPRG